MCGIIGFCNLNGEPVLQASLTKITDSLAHCGHDWNRFYIDSKKIGVYPKKLNGEA